MRARQDALFGRDALLRVRKRLSNIQTMLYGVAPDRREPGPYRNILTRRSASLPKSASWRENFVHFSVFA